MQNFYMYGACGAPYRYKVARQTFFCLSAKSMKN